MKKLQKNAAKNKRFERVMKIASWISDLPNKLTPAPFRLMQIGSLFWQSRALYIIVKIGVADEISSKPTSTLELAKKLDLFEPHLYRLMRFMGSIGVFKETSHRHFVHNKLSKPLVRNSKNNVCDMILMHNSPEMTLPWMDAMEESVKDGKTPFSKCHGSEMFSYMDKNKGLNDLFSNAMNTVEALTGLEYLLDFDWSAFSRIIDLGGSKGSKSISILTEHQNLSAVVFDRCEVIADARESWQGKIDEHVLDRINYEGGDLFYSSLPNAESDHDLFLLIGVFHLLDDAQAVTLLKRICMAMNNFNPTIAIVDAILPETQANITEASFDIQMLMGTNGGERTVAQWKNVFDKANMQLIETVAVQTFAKVMVLKKFGTKNL